jgi:cell division initiation protein
LAISPLDVRNQVFKRKVRGYDIDEVKMFLDAVADCMEDMLKEKETLEREINALRDKADTFSSIEGTLRDTMVTAQRISEEAKVNAQREADQVVKQAELDAQRKISDAMRRVEDLERSRQSARSETLAFVAKLRSLLEAQLSFLASVESEARSKVRGESEGVEIGKDAGS